MEPTEHRQWDANTMDHNVDIIDTVVYRVSRT